MMGQNKDSKVANAQCKKIMGREEKATVSREWRCLMGFYTWRKHRDIRHKKILGERKNKHKEYTKVEKRRLKELNS